MQPSEQPVVDVIGCEEAVGEVLPPVTPITTLSPAMRGAMVNE